MSKLTFLNFLIFIFGIFTYQGIRADTTGDTTCYASDSTGDNSCGDGRMCVTQIINQGKKKFPATCNANYECESNRCEQNICMKVGICKGCGTNGNPPDAITGICCDGLTNAEGKCVYTNTCDDFHNTCEAGYVCQSTSNTKSQGLIEMEQGAALQDLSCTPEMSSCVSNADCCSNICIATGSTVEGVPPTKICAPYMECVRCIEEGNQKADNIDCCPTLVEQAGFCVKFVSPPLASPAFAYTINNQCGIEWQNTDDVLGVYESEYWMAAFEFIFMSQYDTMKDSIRDSDNAYPNSFMGFNHNNFEIAKMIFSMRNPIDNVYHSRIQRFADIVQMVGTQSIRYNSQYQYFQDMSHLFKVNADRAEELAKAYEYILPMFDKSLTEIEQHYWGSYQAKTLGANPRTDEPGGYDSYREAEYNICSKAMIHNPDNLCIKGCLTFADAQTPEGTEFYLSSSDSSSTSTSTVEVYRLVDPVVPTFGGSTGTVSARSSCISNVCDNSYFNNVLNHNRLESTIDLCPSNLVGTVLNTEDMPSDVINSSTKEAETWRNIKITRGVYRHLKAKDPSSDTYAFDMSSDECNPSEISTKICRWTGLTKDCYVQAPAVLKGDDSVLKTSLSLLIGSWSDKEYTGWYAELVLITCLYAACIALAIFLPITLAFQIIFAALASIVTLATAIPLAIDHMALRYYNYKDLSSTEGLIFKKEMGILFERYAKLHFIKFGKVPDPTGQFAINDGMTLAKNMAFSSYLEAFDQRNNEKGSNMYGNECHWDNEGQGQQDYLQKTMIFAELLYNFYTTSTYAWRDAADCMLRKPSEVLRNDGTGMSGLTGTPGSTFQNLVNNNPNTYSNVGPSNQITRDSFSTGTTRNNKNGISAENSSGIANINSERTQMESPILNLQDIGQLNTAQVNMSTTGKAAIGGNSSSLSGNSSNTRLAASKNSPLDKRRNEFLSRYGDNKPLMASLNKEYDNFFRGTSKRLAGLAKSDNSNLPSAPADRMTLPDPSKKNDEAKTNAEIEKVATSLIAKAASKMSPKVRAQMPSYASVRKGMEIYKNNKNKYGQGKDFQKYIDNKTLKNKAGIDIHSDKDASSLFELINYSYRKNLPKIR